GLRLDGARPDLRHVRRARSEAVRADRVHAEGAVDAPGALPARMAAWPEVRSDQRRLGLPAEGLRKVGRAHLPVGEALRGAVRARRGGAVVLGGVERGEWIGVLARESRRVLQAARL